MNQSFSDYSEMTLFGQYTFKLMTNSMPERAVFLETTDRPNSVWAKESCLLTPCWEEACGASCVSYGGNTLNLQTCRPKAAQAKEKHWGDNPTKIIAAKATAVNLNVVALTHAICSNLEEAADALQ